MLDEKNKRGTPNHALTENLATHNSTKQQELTKNNEITKEENDQILEVNTATTGIDFLSLVLKNILNLDNKSEDQESSQTKMMNNQINESIKNAHEKGENIFIYIFNLVTCNLWNGKIENSLEKSGMKNDNKASTCPTPSK